MRITLTACLALPGLFASTACAKEAAKLPPASPAPASAPAPEGSPIELRPLVESPSTTIKVRYELDPRLTKSLYMGSRWVSPPTYKTVQRTPTALVKAIAVQHSTDGTSLSTPLVWTPAQPEMLSVKSAAGGQTHIEVLQAGESRITVTGAGGASSTLLVRATRTDGTWSVEIADAD